jgi:hypothetical protein
MHHKLVYLLFGFALLGFAVDRVRPDADAHRDTAGAYPLVGTWTVVEDGNPTAGPGLIAFTADGIVTVVGPTGRTGLGSWMATGPRTATGTWIIPGEIEQGIAGENLLHVSLEVDAAGAGFSADYDLTQRTISGTTVDTSQGTVHGARIQANGPDAVGSPTRSP